MNKQPNFCFNTICKIFVGILSISVAIIILIIGQSKGILFEASGKEAHLRAVLMIFFGIGIGSAPFYQKKCGDWNNKEIILYVFLALLVEIIPRLIFSLY